MTAEKRHLEYVHRYSSRHQAMVKASPFIGCFYCMQFYKPDDIKEWIDGEGTALCPKCGIDAVLPYKDDAYDLAGPLLAKMHQYYFRG